MPISEELDRRHSEIEGIELSQEEKEKAIWNYKIWKWNRERNAEYWNEQEAKRPNKAEKRG